MVRINKSRLQKQNENVNTKIEHKNKQQNQTQNKMKFIPIKLCPKPRMTKRDRWAKRRCVVRYFQFCDELRLHLTKTPVPLFIEFRIGIKKSYRKSRRLALLSQPHTQKPDCDNLIKAIGDFCKQDDSHLHTICARKVWSEIEGIVIYDTLEEWIQG